jgi:hypothetical protein
MRLLFSLGVVALVGCSSPNAVNLTIIADSSLTPDLRARVVDLTLDVTGVHAKTKSYPVSGLPAETRVQLLPTMTAGMLTVTARARARHRSRSPAAPSRRRSRSATRCRRPSRSHRAQRR